MEVGYRDAAVTLTVQQALLGDCNGDRALNALGVAGFIQAVVNPTGYAAEYLGVYGEVVADVNSDRVVHALDVQGLISLLTQGSRTSALSGIDDATVVPEPGSVAWLLAAATARGIRRRRNSAR